MEGYCREGQDYRSCSAIPEEIKKWSPTVVSYLMVILLFKVTTLEFHIIDFTYKTVSQYLTNLMQKICFTISFISCLYMFYTYRCDGTRGCVIQF